MRDLMFSSTNMAAMTKRENHLLNERNVSFVVRVGDEMEK